MDLNSLYIPPIDLMSGYTLGGRVLDGTSDAIGAVLEVPREGAATRSITHITLTITAKTGTGTKFRVHVEGVANGPAPDGTPLASSAEFSQTDLSVGANDIALSSPLSVSAGQLIALTCRYSSGTCDASNSITASYGTTALRLSAMPVGLDCNAGTWAVAYPPVLVPTYADGRGRSTPAIASVLAISTSWISTLTPNLFKGSLLVPTCPVRVAAVDLALRPATNSDWAICLYDGVTQLARVLVDSDQRWSAHGAMRAGRIEIGAFDLVPGRSYRFVIEPTTTNAMTWAYAAVLPDADAAAAFQGPLIGTESESLNDGQPATWTDYALRAYPVRPVLTHADERWQMTRRGVWRPVWS